MESSVGRRCKVERSHTSDTPEQRSLGKPIRQRDRKDADIGRLSSQESRAALYSHTTEPTSNPAK